MPDGRQIAYSLLIQTIGSTLEYNTKIDSNQRQEENEGYENKYKAK